MAVGLQAERREPRIFTVRGRLHRFGPNQWNVEVQNVAEFRFWCDEIQHVTTRLNWFEAYSRVGSLLGILKSKARRTLKRRTSNGKAKTH